VVASPVPALDDKTERVTGKFEELAVEGVRQQTWLALCIIVVTIMSKTGLIQQARDHVTFNF